MYAIAIVRYRRPIEEVEAAWEHIAERDDWGPFNQQMARIENARQALSPP